MALPNIYTHKNLKFFMAVPLVLLVIGLYFSTHIVLDSSLSGGVTITLQSNTTMSPQAISSAIVGRLHVPTPTVSVSSGSVTVTIAANQSLSNAYDYLLQFYSNQSSYNLYLANATNAKIQLQQTPSNNTYMAALATANAGLNSSLANMNKAVSNELGQLSPFITKPSYNANEPASMAAVAQSSYSNASLIYQQNVISQLRSIVPFIGTPSYQQITVQQSKTFLSSLFQIIIVSFILVSIVVFFIFRSIIPSIAVIFGAANDIIIALGAMGVLGIPLGIASIGGLLMLIGYSIDTDVLTSIRILKRHEGTPEERAFSSMKTGLTMTGAAIASFAVLFVVSLIAYVPTYYEISGVVLFGLIGDLATTWLGNASMVLLYVKGKNKGVS